MKNQKGLSVKHKVLYAVLLGIILVLVAYIFYQGSFVQTLANVALPDLSTAGFIEANISVQIADNYGVVSLANNCYVLSSEVERSQAVSIQDGLDKKVGPRPNVHDLFNDLLKTLDIKVLMVKITKIENDAYHSQFILRQGNTILNFDARPSDAIAIGARTDYLVPLYVNETLLKTEGRNIC